ncbi:MAG: SRPBCC family protein [Gammaproteobacteria bacterium]|nr:SRPBCC family protein [Gammaproteobacteria bacterium]
MKGRLTFTESIDIRVPRAAVWAYFDEPRNLYKWQPSLRDREHVAGNPGRPGAVAKLVYDEGGRKLELTETITLRVEPDALAASYDSGMAMNRMHNRFVALGDEATRWELQAAFEFRGFPWQYIAFLFKGRIAKRLRDDMEHFKEFVESSEGVPPEASSAEEEANSPEQGE